MITSTKPRTNKDKVNESERDKVNKFNDCTKVIRDKSNEIIKNFDRLKGLGQTTIAGKSYESLYICDIQIKGDDAWHHVRLLVNGKLAVGSSIFKTGIWKTIFTGSIVKSSELDQLTIYPEGYKIIEEGLINIADNYDITSKDTKT